MSDFRKNQAKHRRIREMLAVYIDGELPSGDRARVEEHLAGCADCTWELETLRQTVELVGQLPKVPVPHAFTIHQASRPSRVSLFQAGWVYAYLRGATALVAALLILVLAGDVLFQFQRTTISFAPAMAPAKEIAAPAAAPTVVARQEVPPVPMESPGPAEKRSDEGEGVAYAEATPLPPAGEEKALVPMPIPTAPAGIGGGPTAREDATATPLATPALPEGKAGAGATGTPPPSVVIEAPEAPLMLAAAPTAPPQPQMTGTPIPVVPAAPVSDATATPTPPAVAIATATATPAPTDIPLSMVKAPAEVRPTEESTLAGQPARPQEPRLTLLRVVEASLCLLVIALIAATLIVRRRIKT